MIKRITALAFGTAAALACTASAAKVQSPRAPLYDTDMTGSDLQFLGDAGEQDEAQSALDELAATHARTGPVKTLGEALLKDHAAESDALKKLAAGKRVTLPAQPRQKRSDRALAKLSGDSFDKACMERIIDVQKKQVATYEKGSESADAAIRRFARKSLPGLKEHLLLAQKIAGMASAEKLFKTGAPSFASPAVAEAPAETPASGPEGSLELADGKMIAGWVYDPARPNEPLTVDICDGTTVLTTVAAKEFRGDLKQTGKGDGKHFFMLQTPDAFKDGKAHWIRATVSEAHFELSGSPKSVVVPAR